MQLRTTNGWVGYRELDGIYSAFEKKLKKLNYGGYSSFTKQFVFITDTSIIESDEMNEVQTELYKRQEPFTDHFDSVFLYLYGGNLYEFDLKTGRNHCYSIDDVPALADKAFHMAHGDD